MTKISTPLTIISCLLIACALSGCSGPNDFSSEVREANKTNVAKVRSCYMLFKENNGMKAPKDKNELVAFIQESTVIDSPLGRLGIDRNKIDEYFISERDNKEVKVRWGIDGPMISAIVFEAEGVDGKRLIAGADVKEVEEDEYNKNWEGKVKPKGMDGGGGESMEDYIKTGG